MSTIKGGSEQGERWDRSPKASEPTVTVPDFGSFMRQVFPEARQGTEVSMAPVKPAGAPRTSLVRRDYETAFTLLQRASDAFPSLLRHCQQLEADLPRLRSEATDEVRTANGETQQWQQIAVAMKMHIEESEHQIAILRQRVAAAEERLAAASTAEQQASLAIGITTLFHDKIIDAFGVGSAAHSALDAVAQGVLRAPDPPRDTN